MFYKTINAKYTNVKCKIFAVFYSCAGLPQFIYLFITTNRTRSRQAKTKEIKRQSVHTQVWAKTHIAEVARQSETTLSDQNTHSQTFN